MIKLLEAEHTNACFCAQSNHDADQQCSRKPNRFVHFIDFAPSAFLSVIACSTVGVCRTKRAGSGWVVVYILHVSLI